jgi:hypothetical protein
MMKKQKRNKTEVGKRGKGEGEKKLLSKYLLFASILSLALLNFGCQPNQTVLKDVAPPPTPMSTVESKKTSFEQDLRDMQAANFDYILAFRRKDGGVFDKDDKKYLRDNTPIETNRWTSTDEGKAYLAGSGFGFSPENMEALRSRFIVEDYSKPEIKDANKATNESNKSAKSSANTNKTNTNK